MQFEDCMYDCVIDKGTIDTLLVLFFYLFILTIY